MAVPSRQPVFARNAGARSRVRVIFFPWKLCAVAEDLGGEPAECGAPARELVRAFHQQRNAACQRRGVLLARLHRLEERPASVFVPLYQQLRQYLYFCTTSIQETALSSPFVTPSTLLAGARLFVLVSPAPLLSAASVSACPAAPADRLICSNLRQSACQYL